MRTVFADSGHWIALLHPRDQMHERAKAVAAGLESAAIVTTQMVLAEVLNHLSREGGRLRYFGRADGQRLGGQPQRRNHPAD